MVLPTGGRKPGIPGQSRNELTDRILGLGSAIAQVDQQMLEMDMPETPIGRAFTRASVVPYLTPLLDRSEPLRIVYIQEPDGTVYAGWSRGGEEPRFEKSTDGGATWDVLAAALPATPVAMVKLASGTLLMVESTSYTTEGGSNPRVWRSTDDGATWTEVAAGLKFPVISAQGICEGTDGSVMIAEYGNVVSQYRIMRSTDDGVTWSAALTTDGVEPYYDPGHFHSVTYDHIAGKHVAFSDRPIGPTYGGPRIYASDDNGATWALVGVSDGLYTPNFVSPMYFENYIAWGSDNQINGWVGRIKREDFYNGHFDRTETVAQLDQKAAYFTFPIREGVWIMSQSVEHINSDQQTGGYGSHASTVFVVDKDGARVSGGMESYYAPAPVGSPQAVKANFPSYQLGAIDHAGICWVNMPVGRPRAYTALPVTQGWAPPMPVVTTRAIPHLKSGMRFTAEGSSGERPIIDNLPSGEVRVGPRTNSSSAATIRLNEDGSISFYSGGTFVATIPAGGASFRVALRGLDFDSQGRGIRIGGGSPEGVVTAPPGSLYLNWNGGAGQALWVKESGSGNTGWVPVNKRPASATKTANFTTDSATDVYLVDATSGAITATVQGASSHTGRTIWIKKTDDSANAVTVGSSSSVDGGTVALSTQYDAVAVYSDGTTWHVVGRG